MAAPHVSEAAIVSLERLTQTVLRRVIDRIVEIVDEVIPVARGTPSNGARFRDFVRCVRVAG
jgi:hypothetical protein